MKRLRLKSVWGLRAIVGTIALLACVTFSARTAETPAPASVPIIHCTDLFHPHDDPDDHFELATIYAIPELDIKGIVLDQGQVQENRPGRAPFPR